MAIEDRDLKVGTVLMARYKKQERTCEVVETPDGVRYRLDDGTEHKSPSSAGKAAMDGVACNGWRFWSVQGSAPARRAPKAEKPAKSAKPKPTKKVSANPDAAKMYNNGLTSTTVPAVLVFMLRPRWGLLHVPDCIGPVAQAVPLLSQ